MIGPCADHADFESIRLGPAGIAVEHVDRVAGVEKIDCSLPVDDEDVFREPDIDRPPPDIAAGGRMIDDPFVERAAACFGAAADDQAPLEAIAACSWLTASS